MKYNVRDPQTGRFIKSAATATTEVKSSKRWSLRDPITGRFVKKPVEKVEEATNEEPIAEEVPAWKREFDKQMALFNDNMAKFNELIKQFA